MALEERRRGAVILMSSALAASQGSRSDQPSASGSAGGLRCATIGLQLARNVLKAGR